MLDYPELKEDEEQLIDEVMSFFFGTSQTTASAV